MPHQEENNGLVVPRAREPTTTPAEPRDSTLVRNRVPAACPTPAWVTPMVNGEGKFLRNPLDRKSTRLNSSHVASSYAVFCLKKKKRASYRFSAALRSSLWSCLPFDTSSS